MKVKVCFNNEIRINTTRFPTFEEFKNYVSGTFQAKLPSAWHLQYLDPDDEKIEMTDQSEYEGFLGLESEYQGKFARVYVVIKDAKDAPVRKDKEEPRILSIEANLAANAPSDIQVIENPKSHIKIEKVVPKPPVVNNAVPVSGKQENEEEKEIHQEEEEEKEEKAGQCFFPLSPRKIKDGITEKQDIKAHLKEKLDSSGIDLFQSEERDPKNNNKEEQKNVVEQVVPKVPVDIRVNDVVPVIAEQKSEIKNKIQQEEEEKFYQVDKKQELIPLNVELNEALGLIENLKVKVENASSTVVSINRHYNLGLSQVEVAPKKEVKRGYLYFKTLHEKAGELQKVFNKEDYNMLCAYVDNAPEELTVAELIENYKH